MRNRVIAALALALVTAAARAQTIRGAAVDVTGRPLAGVVVLMVDSASGVVARALTNGQGEFHVSAARAGAYRLRTMRIGYRTTTSDPIPLLTGGEVTRRLVIAGVQLSLDTVRVVGRSSCRLTTDSSAAATFAVWEQVRTALTAAQLTALGRSITATTITYDRTLDPNGRRAEQQTANVRTDYVTQPWRALSPDDLHRTGYVFTGRDNSVTYHAPGIDALLSAGFVEDHCFRLAGDGSQPRLLGIAFEPSPDRKALPEIRGTLWVDRATSELRRLDYRYANVSADQESAGAGGSVELVRMSNGGWAISRWSIRMPVLEETMRTQALGGIQTHVAAIKVSGGELALATALSPQGRDTLWARPALVMVGAVVDSVSGAAVGGAQVSLSGTSLEATTDARGWFAIRGVLPGSYTLETRTPSLDAIGAVHQSAVTFTDSAASIELRVPTAGQIASSLCAGTRLDPGGGMLVGAVYVRGDSAPYEGANVVVEWTDFALRDEHGVTALQQGRRIEARTGGRGAFRICNVPVNTALTLRASGDSAEGAPVELRLTSRRFARVDLTMERRIPRPTDFSGFVLDSMHVPISGADISLPDLALATLSDQTGAFRLGGIPAGAQRVLVRRVGYSPLDTTVAFGDKMGTARMIVLSRAVRLDSVVSSAAAIDPMMSDFEDNRRIGLGHFITRAELAKLEDLKVADVLEPTPGVGVIRGRYQAFLTSKRATPAACAPADPNCRRSEGFYVPDRAGAAVGQAVACYAQVYLDAQLMNRGAPTEPFDINSILPAEIEGLEWYAGPAQTPARYSGLGSRCGVLVIHTRRTE